MACKCPSSSFPGRAFRCAPSHSGFDGDSDCGGDADSETEASTPANNAWMG